MQEAGSLGLGLGNHLYFVCFGVCFIAHGLDKIPVP